MTVPPGHAIVDPGAAQDLIGKAAFDALTERLAKTGLRPVILQEEPPSAAGIGGSATPLFVALSPIFLGGKPGVVKLVVLSEDVPHLLSIGLLEHTKAIIDTSNDRIEFKQLNASAPMIRLSSGHRVIDIAGKSEGFFPPVQVLQQ